MLSARSILSIICAGAAVQAVDATAGRLDIREIALLTQNSAVLQPDQASAKILKSLAGVWKAREYRVYRSSDLDVQVFGRDASDVRKVTLTIQPSGEAVLTVLSSMVDQNGTTIAGTASIDEAKLVIRPPDGATTGGIQLGVTVVHAEKRYLDDSADRWPLTGLAVPLSISAPDANEMNFRFDTAEGRGSFGDTLLRQHRGRSRRN